MIDRFERPDSIAEAARLLAAGRRALLAGGTDLYPAHVGRSLPLPLVDLSAIAALRGIRRDGSGWSIGATTTWSDVLQADLPPSFDALKGAAAEIGGVQIQNMGTVAGNLCNASPAADGMPVLLAMGASVVLASVRGERELPLAAFVLGSRRTALAGDEFVTAVRLPASSARARSAFVKLGGRRHLTISMTMVAVALDADEAGRIVSAGAAVGSCSAVAQRLPRLEQALVGAKLDDDLALCVEPACLAPLAPIDDLRATAAYRQDATLTLLRRTLDRLGKRGEPGDPGEPRMHGDLGRLA